MYFNGGFLLLNLYLENTGKHVLFIFSGFTMAFAVVVIW